MRPGRNNGLLLIERGLRRYCLTPSIVCYWYRQLKRLRLTHGLVYVNRGAAKLEQAQEDAYPLVHMELNAGQATRYGLVLSHTNIRLRSE